MTASIYQNALFLSAWSINLIIGRTAGWREKYKLHLVGHFSDTCSVFCLKKDTLVHKEMYSPTDELVFSWKVEVIVEVEALCPPLHPLLLHVCERRKHVTHNLCSLDICFELNGLKSLLQHK